MSAARTESACIAAAEADLRARHAAQSAYSAATLAFRPHKLAARRAMLERRSVA